MEARLSFASDYMEGAHPSIMQRLAETNLCQTPGYGQDHFTEEAKQKIRDCCQAPDAEIYFLTGGTQTNATVIDALLMPYQGVIAADTGHISIHEAGAIEAGGHKVLTLPHHHGKISAGQIRSLLAEYQADPNHEHMVMPGMVYLSQPTEYGTLYSLAELEDISRLCQEYRIPLYLDGARLAYALACPENDVSLQAIAALCDVFYIGGTKCGALFGEAVIINREGGIPYFFTMMKQHGALLAKGRLLGIQFDVLFSDRLYERIGESAIAAANRLREILRANGIPLCFDSPTNQIFCIVENELMSELARQVEFSFWEKYDGEHSVIRFATSWATSMQDVEKMAGLLGKRT